MLTCRRCGGLTPPGSPTVEPPCPGSSAQIACLHCEAPLPRPPRWARRLSALLGPAGAILLAACYGAPGRYHGIREPMPDGLTRVDRDHDGAPGPYECRHPTDRDCAERIARTPPPEDVDCDDANPAHFPGAADVDGDGVDSNCDGVDGWTDAPPAVRVQPAPAVRAVDPAEPAGAPPAGAARPGGTYASPPAVIAQPPASP